MPFSQKGMEFVWGDNILIPDDTMRVMGAPAIEGAPAIDGGKHGFGGRLFPTELVLHMLQGLDVRSFPDGFSVPAGTGMSVLLVYNGVQDVWEPAWPGCVSQRIHADNMVHTLFGHTMAGCFRDSHGSESFFAYVRSGGLFYYAVVSLLLQCCINAPPTSITAAPIDDSSVVFAPCQYEEPLGGLGLFNAEVFGENIDIEDLDIDDLMLLIDSPDDSTNMRLTWEDPARDCNDSDALSQANTPVAIPKGDMPGKHYTGDDDDFLHKRLPDAFDFGQPETADDAKGDSPARPARELGVETEAMHAPPLITRQVVVPMALPAPVCKRVLQLDMPAPRAPTPEPAAPEAVAPEAAAPECEAPEEKHTEPAAPEAAAPEREAQEDQEREAPEVQEREAPQRVETQREAPQREAPEPAAKKRKTRPAKEGKTRPATRTETTAPTAAAGGGPRQALKDKIGAWVEVNRNAHLELGSLGPAFDRVVQSLARCAANF